MTLEPVLPTLDDDENPELADFRRRFWWTLPLTVVVTLLAMVGHRLQWFDMATQCWIELVLSVPIVLWAGWPFFVRGVQFHLQGREREQSLDLSFFAGLAGDFFFAPLGGIDGMRELHAGEADIINGETAETHGFVGKEIDLLKRLDDLDDGRDDRER